MGIRETANGDYVIRKGTFALIMVVIALIGVVGTAVAYGVTLKADVDHLKEQYTEAGPRYTDTIDEFNKRLDGIDIENTKCSANLEYIKGDIEEMKSDIKLLLAK